MKEKERVFEHSRFNSSINAGYIARDIITNTERGTATEEKIVTVLNAIHATEHISSLNRINTDVIKNYENYLKDRYDNKSTKPLKAHSVQGYAAAMNAITNYINLRTDKNLPEVSAFKDLGIKNVIKYGGKSTPTELFKRVYEKLSEANQIKQELQRNLGLRVRESHWIKIDTIKEALQTGILRLNAINNDGTKNSRMREMKIWTDKQRNTLIKTLNYMEKTGQKSMIENDKTWAQAQDKFYRDMEKAGGTRAANNGNNFCHGNRHYNTNDKADNILPAFKIKNEKEIDKICSQENGHGELRTTDIYRGKH